MHLAASTVCPACGTTNASTNTFCVNCGTRLGAAAAAPGAPAAGPPLAGPPPVAAYPGGYPYYALPFPRRATFSDMLSGLFDVYTKNFLPFFVVYLALGAATGVLSLVLSFAIFGTVRLGGAIGGLPATSFPNVNFGLILLDAIATFVVSAILASIVTGAMTEYAVRRYRGEPMTVEQALRRGLARFPSILGANILLGLILFGLVTIPLLLIVVALLTGLTSTGGAVALLCGGAILLVVLGLLAIFLYVSLVLYAPAIMMENTSAVGGLSRSWRMTRGHRWSLFGAILVAGLLAGVISLAISFPLTLASLTSDPIVSAFVSIVSSAFISALVGSWTVILVAVAYELIVRRPLPFFGAAPPYVAGPGIAPPLGAAQTGPPPPSGPPPGP
ncbi:MAG TPA: hypothetical protein VNP71_07695 [Thermoplasmata archaeon]|nr:hypothetical protein [Thermoplasmata archaeon]